MTVSEIALSLVRAGLRALREAWAVPYVKIGLVATLIIAVGSLTPAYLPQASPVWPVLRGMGLDGQVGRVIGTIMTVSGIFLLIDAWFRLRHRVFADLTPLAVVAIWSLPLLISPPVFSHDMYSYAAQGWMIHNGQNPYHGGPGLVPGPFSDYAPWVWRYTPAPYGPLALQIAHLIATVSGGQPWLAAALMRLPAIAGVVCIVVFLPKIARRIGIDPHPVTWFACLNPLLIIDYVGGGHNDGWMMGLVVVGLWVATRPGWWPVAAGVIGVAASIKQPAIVAAVFLPLLMIPFDSWRQTRLAGAAIARSIGSVGIAVAGFVVISLLCGLGFGWLEALGVPGSVGSISPSYLIGSGLQNLIDPSNTWWLDMVQRVIQVMGLAIVVVITLKFGPNRPLKALSWSWIVLALTAAALHPWYMLWGMLILPLGRESLRLPWASVLGTVLLLCYAALGMGERNGFIAVIAAVICLLIWLAHLVIYHRFWTLLPWRSLRPLESKEDE